MNDPLAKMNIPEDTSPEMEAAQLELWRRMEPAERFQLAMRLSSEVICASKRAIARLYPELDSQEIGQRFVELHYGKELADSLRAHQGKPHV